MVQNSLFQVNFRAFQSCLWQIKTNSIMTFCQRLKYSWLWVSHILLFSTWKQQNLYDDPSHWAASNVALMNKGEDWFFSPLPRRRAAAKDFSFTQFPRVSAASASHTEARQHVSTGIFAPTTCRLATVKEVRLRGCSRAQLVKIQQWQQQQSLFFFLNKKKKNQTECQFIEKRVFTSTRFTSEAILGVKP